MDMQMEMEIEEQIDKYRIITIGEEIDKSKLEGRHRRKTQYYQVKAAVNRERASRKTLNRLRRDHADLKDHDQTHKAEILELEARKFEDDKTISELRREIQGLKKELKSQQHQQQPSPPPELEEVQHCRSSQRCKRRKAKLKKLKAQRNALREELDVVRKQRMMELEKAVEREEPYLLGVFRLMRREVDDLREQNSRLVETNTALISRATT